MLRARVALANLGPEILAADNERRIALALVNDTLGRPVMAPIEVDAALEIPAPLPQVAAPQELLAVALENRPELIRFGVDRRVLENRVGVVQSDVLPQFDANATIGVNTFSLEQFADTGFRSWAVGVSMTWTIFDGLSTQAAMGALRSQVSQKQYEEASFRSTLALELERATGTWTRALEAVEVASIAVEQAREAERVAEEFFRWGAATTLDVLESTRALRDADFNQSSGGARSLGRAGGDEILGRLPGRCSQFRAGGDHGHGFQRIQQWRLPLRATTISLSLTLALGAWLLLVGTGCGSGEPSDSSSKEATSELPALNVSVVELRPTDFTECLVLAGRLEPWVEVQVSTELGGSVEEVSFEKGNFVQAGRVLTRVGSDLRAVELEGAEADLLAAEAHFNRTSSLLERQAVPRLELVSATSRYKMAQARVDKAKILLERSIIKAPISGVALSRQIEPGEVLPPGAPITTLHSLNRLKVVTGIPENDISFFEVNGEATVTVDAYPGRDFEGRIHYLAPSGVAEKSLVSRGDRARQPRQRTETRHDRPRCAGQETLSRCDGGSARCPAGTRRG